MLSGRERFYSNIPGERDSANEDGARIPNCKLSRALLMAVSSLVRVFERVSQSLAFSSHLASRSLRKFWSAACAAYPRQVHFRTELVGRRLRIDF